MKCIIVAERRRLEREATMDRVTNRKRKEIIVDSIGTNKFVMVSREMLTTRTNTNKFPDTTRGDIAKDFEEPEGFICKQLPALESQTLTKKRNTDKEISTVRQGSKVPRNVAKAMRRPDSKD